MFRMIPPAGTPASIVGIIQAFASWLKPATVAKFEKDLKNYTGTKRIFFVSSGQAAQYLLLKVFSTLAGDNKNEVIIPAYTCYTVAASIAKAGFKIHPVDINPATLDYDYEQLQSTDLSNVLAINSSNLFGILSDWSIIDRLAKNNNFFAIDDAAQSFGSKTDKQMSGNHGDGGFYSLGRGKNMSAWSGGLLVSSNLKVIGELEKLISKLSCPGIITEVSIFIKYIISSLLLHPSLYRLPASLPFLKLGETIYDDTFSVDCLTKMQISIALQGLTKLDSWNSHRAATAHKLAKALTESGKYKIPGFDLEKKINYLRLPVLAENSEKRDAMIAKLAHVGVVASKMYPTTISEISQIETLLVGNRNKYPGAQTVVDRLFTLPTHPYVKTQDIEKIIDCLI